MGKSKKKKAKSLLRSSNVSSNNEFTSFQDEVIQNLQLFKESNGLVVGFNAVIRSIEKNSLSVIIYISRRGVSAMYHALNLMCKGKDVLFIQLQDINTNVFNLKIPFSTTYGIKKSVLDQPQFSKLLEKVSTARNSRKNEKEKTVQKFAEEFFAESESSFEPIKSDKSPSVTSKELFVYSHCKDATSENISRKSDVNSFIHAKHEKSKQKYTGKQELLKLIRNNKETIHRHYVGYIEKQCDDRWLVRFARHVEGKKFKWPERENVSIIDEGQIEKNIKSTRFYL